MVFFRNEHTQNVQIPYRSGGGRKREHSLGIQNSYRKFVFRGSISCCVFGQNFRPTEAPLAPTHKYASIEKSTPTSYPHILNKNPLRLSDRNFGPEFRVYIYSRRCSIHRAAVPIIRTWPEFEISSAIPICLAIYYFFTFNTHIVCVTWRRTFFTHTTEEILQLFGQQRFHQAVDNRAPPPPVPAISLAVQKSQWGFRPYVRIHPGGLGRKELKDALVLPRTGDCVYIVVGG